MRRSAILLNRRPAVHARPSQARILEITTWLGGRTMPVPQSFYDAMAVDYKNSNTHPHLGTYTHVAVDDGNWSNPAIWDTGTVPGHHAVVNVAACHVVYDVYSDTVIEAIHVSGAGKFEWDTTKDTRLRVDTLMFHGIPIMGTEDQPIPESTTPGMPRAEVIWHAVQSPGKTTRLGWNSMGPSRVHGARKAERLFATGALSAGQTQITLTGLSTAIWRVGDTVIAVGTGNPGFSPTDAHYTGPTQFYGPYNNAMGVRTQTLGFKLTEDEEFTIVAINGNVLTLSAPLVHDREMFSGQIPMAAWREHKPLFVNVSRSIRFRSHDPSSLQTRGHAMFMFHDDVDVRYAEFKDMGRTDTDPSLAQPDGTLAYATNGGSVITDANNVRGRYPFHVHGTGPFFGRKQVKNIGVSVWAPMGGPPIPGWAFVHHHSRVAIENCVTFNARGSGFVSELGTEIGQWFELTSIYNRGDGFPWSWGSRDEWWQNHNGHAGVAYENQARQVLQRGCIAASSSFAWKYMQQNVAQSSRVPDRRSLRLKDPLTTGKGSGSSDPEFLMDEYSYGIENAQIPPFDDNVAIACHSALSIAHRQFTVRTDTTPLIARRFDCLNCDTAFDLINYTYNYSFYDCLWIGTGKPGAAAAELGNISWGMNFVRMLIRNFDVGFRQSGIGFNLNGFPIDIVFENVNTPYTHFTGNFDLTAWAADNPGGVFPDDFFYKDFMGPMVTTSYTPGVNWQGILREFKTISSVTDLPQPYPSAPARAGGVEPLPGTPKPYFWFDPAGDYTLGTTGNISVYGYLVDSVGVRNYPDWFSSESFSATKATSTYPPATRTYSNEIDDLVLDNGCWLDNGVWKTRCWVPDHDRLTGDFVQGAFDLILPTLDADFLAANTVDPATKPDLSFALERVDYEALAPNTTPPVIASPAAMTVDEGVILRFFLKCNDGLASWSITGGADQGRFALSSIGGVNLLTWAANGVKNFASPDDADGNNVYEVQVTVTNPFGYSSTKAIAITVRDKNTAVNAAFSDSFTRVDEAAEANANWSRIGGGPGQAAIVSNGMSSIRLPDPYNTRAAYLSPNTGSVNHYVQGTTSNPNVFFLAVSITDENNFIGVNRSELGGACYLYSVVGGVFTELAVYSSANSAATVRLEINGGDVSLLINGVLKGTVTPASPPPATTRAGFVTRTPGGSLDNFASGAL